MNSRRNFLKVSTIASLGMVGLYKFAQNPLLAATSSRPVGYGSLLPDRKGLLNLPEGFSYKIISEKGSKMSDGFFTPGNPDGMATFQGKKGRVIIIRNHEISPTDLFSSPFGINNELLSKIKKKKLYDFGKGALPSLGGTTTLVYNPATQTVETEYLSLAGTIRNCAGGPTPWNSWISCEENVSLKGHENGMLEQNHGYNFEVPASEKIRIAKPVPLKAMGRMNHEAVAVHPETSIVYQTEDRADGLIYRFLPKSKNKLAKGGKLQALAIKDEKSRETRNWEHLEVEKFPLGKAVEVEWIDLDNVEAPDDDLRLRGFELGAARFARGEGMWMGENEVFFACTNGGLNLQGQIFRYIPSPHEGQPQEKEMPGKLELFAEPNNTLMLKNCDNLTVAPWGDVVTCEDHPHPFVVGITPQGEYYQLAENVGFESEFAGGVFSPDGETFFLNIQGAGMTVAITGPWRQKVVG